MLLWHFWNIIITLSASCFNQKLSFCFRLQSRPINEHQLEPSPSVLQLLEHSPSRLNNCKRDYLSLLMLLNATLWIVFWTYLLSVCCVILRIALIVLLWLCESYCRSYSYFSRKLPFELLVKLVLVTHHFQSHYSCCNFWIVCSFNHFIFLIYVIWLALKPNLHPFTYPEATSLPISLSKYTERPSFLLHPKMDTNMNEDNNNQEPNAASRMRQAGFDPAVQVVSHVRTTGKPYFLCTFIYWAVVVAVVGVLSTLTVISMVAAIAA